MELKIHSTALMGSGWLQHPGGWKRRHQVYAKKRQERVGEKQKYNLQGAKKINAAVQEATAGIGTLSPKAMPLKHPQITQPSSGEERGAGAGFGGPDLFIFCKPSIFYYYF